MAISCTFRKLLLSEFLVSQGTALPGTPTDEAKWEAVLGMWVRQPSKKMAGTWAVLGLVQLPQPMKDGVKVCCVRGLSTTGG